ncbi:MAG: Ig-like domain-containing protein [Leptolyngbyaceae cyanobacterium SL_7_1]|nr:Ig-like domain-containing protein [Leptolyngbyaceae cyanobacterium SL_7_1]
MQQKSPSFSRWFTQPLDRVALIAMVILGVLMALLVLSGDHTAPRVRQFSWQDKQVGATDSAFLLTFSRPMDRTSVEDNLRVVPPLPGKISWAGRRMAYTLEAPAPYGTAFQVELQDARDRFAQTNARPIHPFTGRFRSRDRAFVYLGLEGEEAGRLVLENLTRQEHKILTPASLAVLSFKPYPQGDRILFSATDRAVINQSQLEQKLYTVSTGIDPQSPDQLLTNTRDRPVEAPPQPVGTVTLVLDSQDYQNLKFDLSPDGQKIVLQRANRNNPADFGLWLIEADQPPKPLKTQPGGDFLIAPDSNSIAMSQGQGLAILPLESGADPLSFLAKYGLILAFSNDGSQAATVQFGAELNNPIESLYVVDNAGNETNVLQTDGSLVSAEFDPAHPVLYVLVADRIPNPELYLEQPYLVAINLETAERTDLLKLPIQRDLQMSLAPDGLGILLDQVTSAEGVEPGVAQSEDGSAIVSSRLWFLPLVLDETGNPSPTEPQALPLMGLNPRWLP